SALGASSGASGMGGFSRAGANGTDLSRAALGCARGTHHSAQANLPDVQRLHDGAAERIAVWVLSPGQLLQRVRASRPAEGREGEAMIPHGYDRRQGEQSSASREKPLCKEECDSENRE